MLSYAMLYAEVQPHVQVCEAELKRSIAAGMGVTSAALMQAEVMQLALAEAKARLQAAERQETYAGNLLWSAH